MFKEEESLYIYVNSAVDTQQIEKERLLKELITVVSEGSSIRFDVQGVFSSVLEREAVSTTGFGEGFAIPHGKASDLKKPLVAVMKLQQGVEWESMDEQKVNTVILLIVPKENGEVQHLKLLSRLSYNLMDEEIQLAIKQDQTDEALQSTVQLMLTEI
ncbi:PTS sugar transporter subunit IIA [Alkalibacterium olivapovliticus]|uniref:PTS system fructose-specific IIA component/PTS system fructose-specific IIC component n=1 Tax=Alkalibacterium olivapovliticus TaxID=99907 RepID=A0A2T0W5T3_9LACT|nr:PTS sugar transporter subunit IIA [Alkalibacterium olivapovliticus]PRY81435.1 PTS system fructose-specific IIA component/PTS system fructose-specific IIC component [Alkalibacterium olivapovliticus]